MIYRYRVHGMTLASVFPIPEFPVATDPDPHDVVLEVGQVPGCLPEATTVGALAQAGRGSYLLRVPGVAAYHIPSRCRIVVEPVPSAPSHEVRAYLLSAVMDAHTHARGLLPVHASAIRGSGGCILLAGPSGSGKSTLTAGLLRAGYTLWGDDLMAVSLAPDGIPVAHQGTTTLRLRRDDVRWRRDDAGPADGSLPRFSTPAAPGGLPVRRMYLLGQRQPGPVAFRSLRGAERVRSVLRQVSRRHLAGSLGQPAMQFRIAAAVAAVVEIVEVNHSYRQSEMERLVDATMIDLAEAGITPEDGTAC